VINATKLTRFCYTFITPDVDRRARNIAKASTQKVFGISVRSKRWEDGIRLGEELEMPS